MDSLFFPTMAWSLTVPKKDGVAGTGTWKPRNLKRKSGVRRDFKMTAPTLFSVGRRITQPNSLPLPPAQGTLPAVIRDLLVIHVTLPVTRKLNR